MKVEVSNIHFGYKRAKPVINGVSFDVQNGEIFGILGSSGCGKSTLLRIICGLLKMGKDNLYEGSVMINGDRDTQNLRKQGMIGLMFQQPSLLPNLTLKENIILPTLMNAVLNVNGEIANELIHMVGLAEYKNYLPKELSGGMQTRAELARTFITKPKLLLLDEPFSSLDYGWKIDLYSKLVNLVKQFNSTTIIVSHDINELVLLADRIIVLSKTGKLIENDIRLNGKPSSYSVKDVSDYLHSNNDLTVSIQSQIINDKAEILK